jgi:DNA-binding NtrC family response regulator
MEDGRDVLVLDDEAVVGDRLKPAIEQDGHRVEVFVDPREALKRVEVKKFDIVVTDIRMENINGIEVLERVIAKDERTKVIIITGYATMELAREAMGKMAFDFVAKPFKLKEIREIVNNAAKALEAGE